MSGENTSGSLRDRLRSLSSGQLTQLCEMVGLGDTERTMVAYVVPEDGARLSAAELRGALAGVLPLALIPGEIAVVDGIPRTANGKVDSEALRMTAPTAAHGGGTIPADGPLAQLIESVWREEIGVPQDEPVRDFFGSGGTSIVAMRSLSRLGRILSCQLPLVALFRNPRPDLFADYLLEREGPDGAPALLAAAADGLRLAEVPGLGSREG